MGDAGHRLACGRDGPAPGVVLQRRHARVRQLRRVGFGGDDGRDAGDIMAGVVKVLQVEDVVPDPIARIACLVLAPTLNSSTNSTRSSTKTVPMRRPRRGMSHSKAGRGRTSPTAKTGLSEWESVRATPPSATGRRQSRAVWSMCQGWVVGRPRETGPPVRRRPGAAVARPMRAACSIPTSPVVPEKRRPFGHLNGSLMQRLKPARAALHGKRQPVWLAAPGPLAGGTSHVA